MEESESTENDEAQLKRLLIDGTIWMRAEREGENIVREASNRGFLIKEKGQSIDDC